MNVIPFSFLFVWNMTIVLASLRITSTLLTLSLILLIILILFRSCCLRLLWVLPLLRKLILLLS
jgi:hypothetical protein